MAEVMAQREVGLAAPSSRQDVVSELLDDYTYEDLYDTEDVPPTSNLAPPFKEFPLPPPRIDSLRDSKSEAVQRMNTKFQLREDDEASVSSNGSPNSSSGQTPRTRITSRSLSRSGTPPSLKLFVSNGSTAAIPPTPVTYAPVKSIPSSIPFESKELPPSPPARSIKRNEVQAAARGHQPSKSELERNDSCHSQSEDRSLEQGSFKRKAVPGAGVSKFVSLFELNNGPRASKPAPAPTSTPGKMGDDQQTGVIPNSNVAKSETPVSKEVASNQLPPTPPENKSVPSPPRKALVGVGLPSNPRPKAPISPLHTRGKSSTGFNILKAQRPAPRIPTVKKEVTAPETTPSPTLKSEVRIDNDISPMKSLPPTTEHSQPFTNEGLGEQHQGASEQVIEQQKDEEKDEQTCQLPPPTVAPPVPTPPAQPDFSLRTTSLDPPEPSPSFRPSTAPAPQSTFPTTHLSLSTSTLPLDSAIEPQEPPFIPLTRQPIPLRVNLIPRITPSQLSCYTRHTTHVWSNNVFQPMGCMICHANDKDRKFSCTWCQLRICRGCSDELKMVPGRDLATLLEVRKAAPGMHAQAPKLVVDRVDEVGEDALAEKGEVDGSKGTGEEAETQTETERGRSMARRDSRERTQ